MQCTLGPCRGGLLQQQKRRQRRMASASAVTATGSTHHVRLYVCGSSSNSSSSSSRGQQLQRATACPPSTPAAAAAAGGAAVGPLRACGVSRRSAVACRAADERPSAGGSGGLSAVKFNPVYLAILGAFSALLVFRNPYIYAVLTVVTILPQNSNVTSLNNLVLLFYESGVFANFGEAVTAVRLVTWLSMIFMVGSFAVFK